MGLVSASQIHTTAVRSPIAILLQMTRKTSMPATPTQQRTPFSKGFESHHLNVRTHQTNPGSSNHLKHQGNPTPCFRSPPMVQRIQQRGIN